MQRIKRIIVFMLIANLVFACETGDSDATSKKNDNFYVTFRIYRKPDTSDYKPGFKQSENTSLLYGKRFSFKDTSHILRLFLRDGAAIDDEALLYVLDSIGVIYSKSLVWGGYSFLVTNNDSLRERIDEAKNQIIADPKLHCYQCERYDQSPKLVIQKMSR